MDAPRSIKMRCPKCNSEMIAASSFLLWGVVKQNAVIQVCPDPNCLEAIVVEELKESSMFVAKAMVKHQMVGTITEARACIRQRAVWVNDKLVIKPTERLNNGDKIRVGETRVVIHSPISEGLETVHRTRNLPIIPVLDVLESS